MKINQRAAAMRYYDLKRNWPRVRPHLDDPKLQALLARDFNKYTWGRWRQRFEPGMLPTRFESCDWQCDHRGKPPAFWAYTKHAACHWLVNFTLKLAERSVPTRTWRIISSQHHSTVWDGERTLFDFNFQAMGVSPQECFTLACKKQLRPGDLLKVHLAQHWRRES